MIYSYYLEAKNRFYLIFLTWFSFSIICYFYNKILLFFIIDKKNYYGLSTMDSYFILPNNNDFYYVLFQLVFLISNQLGLIAILYHVLMFFSCGFSQIEYKKCRLLIKILFFYSICSIPILHYYIIPNFWDLCLNIQDDFQPVSLFYETSFRDYFIFYFSLYHFLVFNFQLFFILLFFINELFSSIKQIKIYRKFLYLLFICFATLVTSDIFSQVILSCCFVFIYELIIFNKLLVNKVTN